MGQAQSSDKSADKEPRATTPVDDDDISDKFGIALWMHPSRYRSSKDTKVPATVRKAHVDHDAPDEGLWMRPSRTRVPKAVKSDQGKELATPAEESSDMKSEQDEAKNQGSTPATSTTQTTAQADPKA